MSSSAFSRRSHPESTVATLIYAGLRREEALWLTIDDVDLEKRLIYVRAKSINEEHWQPKTKRNRVVPVSSISAESFCPIHRSARSHGFSLLPGETVGS